MIRRTRQGSDTLVIAAAVLVILTLSGEADADMDFYPPYAASGYDDGGPSISDQFISGSADANTGQLSVVGGTGPEMTQPWGKAWIEETWNPGPQDYGRVAVTVAEYDKDFFATTTNSGAGGGAVAKIFLNLIVFEGGDEIGRIMVERRIQSCMSIFPPQVFSSSQDSLVFYARSDRSYRIRVELEAEALQFEECDRMGALCDNGIATVDVWADIDHIAIKTCNRPWTSVSLQRPRGDMMHDTWNAYEQLRYVAERRTYYPVVATIELDAGGYYDGDRSEIVFTCPNDSIISFSVNPRHFGGDLSSTPDSLRLKIPEAATQESWTITVNIAPEVEEIHMAACAIAYPLAALWRTATGCSVAMTALGVTPDDLFNNEHWAVKDPGDGQWRPLLDAVEEGWNCDIIDPGDVAWVDPFTLLDELPGWGETGYLVPDPPEVVRNDIENQCRGIDPITMHYTRWPKGDNSYAEDRMWFIDVSMQGRNNYTGLRINEHDEQEWQVNFDYYPLERSYAVNDVPNIRVVRLEPNTPNPFNPVTTITFELGVDSMIHLAVYDMLGREVSTLIDGPRSQGRHETTFRGLDQAGAPLPSGVYICALESQGQRWARKMALVH